MFVANASHELRMPLAVLKAELEVSLRERGGERAAPRRRWTRPSRRPTGSSSSPRTCCCWPAPQDGTLPDRAHGGRPSTELLVGDPGAVSPVDRARRAARSTVDAGDDPPRRSRSTPTPTASRRRSSNLIDNTLRYGAGPVTFERATRAGLGRDPRHRPRPGLRRGSSPTRSTASAGPTGARRRGGVGLGLAIVRTIAQAHGGDAGARDLPDGGADVWVSLPATASRSRDPALAR